MNRYTSVSTPLSQMQYERKALGCEEQGKRYCFNYQFYSSIYLRNKLPMLLLRIAARWTGAHRRVWSIAGCISSLSPPTGLIIDTRRAVPVGLGEKYHSVSVCVYLKEKTYWEITTTPVSVQRADVHLRIELFFGTSISRRVPFESLFSVS